ncbi:MAG: HAD-IIB family hydrolase [Zestosphaera sp.]
MAIGYYFDFDGTLSPIDVGRDAAYPSPEVFEMLRHLSEKHVVAVVSSKDCHFLLRRLPYVHGLGCINGSEVVGGGYVAVDELVYRGGLVEVLESILKMLRRRADCYIEEKRTLQGILAGVSIDWRASGRMPDGLDDALKLAKSRGLNILRYGGNPFIDIYVSSKGKDSAVRVLKTLLGVSKVVYVGDGENDIPAFNVADVRVLVRHKYNKGLMIESEYEVGFEELPRWLIENASRIV